MGCGCGGSSSAVGIVYKIVTTDGEVLYRESRGEAQVLRAQRGMLTKVLQVPRAEMDKWLAAQSAQGPVA